MRAARIFRDELHRSDCKLIFLLTSVLIALRLDQLYEGTWFFTFLPLLFVSALRIGFSALVEENSTWFSRLFETLRQLALAATIVIMALAADEMEALRNAPLAIPKLTADQFAKLTFTPWIVATPLLISEAAYFVVKLIELPLFFYHAELLTQKHVNHFPAIRVGRGVIAFYFTRLQALLWRVLCVIALAALSTARLQTPPDAVAPSLLLALIPIILMLLFGGWIGTIIALKVTERISSVDKNVNVSAFCLFNCFYSDRRLL